MTSKLQRNPPFRAEHLGSLLRPDDLLQSRADLDNGKTQQQQLTSIEDTSVKDIVDTQIKLGFHPISDGEYRRHSMFLAYPIYLMSLLTRYGSVLGHLLPWPGRLQGDQEPRRRHLSYVYARHCSLYRVWSQAWRERHLYWQDQARRKYLRRPMELLEEHRTERENPRVQDYVGGAGVVSHAIQGGKGVPERCILERQKVLCGHCQGIPDRATDPVR